MTWKLPEGISGMAWKFCVKELEYAFKLFTQEYVFIEDIYLAMQRQRHPDYEKAQAKNKQTSQ